MKIILSTLFPFFLFAQWVQTSGPEGGHVGALYLDGSNLFAGTYNGGVFRSSNNGNNWSESNTGIQYTSIEDINKSGSYLLATGTIGIYRSTDNGNTWTSATGLPSANGVRRLAVDGSTVYAATSGKGIYKSTDNGATWTSSSSGLPNSFSYTYCGDVLVNGSTVLCTATDNSNAGVFRSTNGGTSWTSTNSSIMGFSAANVLRLDGVNIFVADESVWKSSDGGMNWSAAGTGIPSNAGISDILVDGSNVFAAGKFLYRSTNNGINWSIADSVTIRNTTLRLLKLGTNLYLGTAGRGVYSSSDNGSSWISKNVGLRAKRNSHLLYSGVNIFAVGSGLFKTSDAGVMWTNSDQGLEKMTGDASIFQKVNNILFLGADKIYRSTDNGLSWSPPVSGNPAFGVTSIAGTSNVLFAAANSLHKSTDQGLNWNQVTTVWFPYCLVNTGGAILAGTNNGIFRSTNEGTSWNAATGLPSFTGIRLFAVVGTTIFAAKDLSAGIYKSTDDGASWTALGSIPGVTNSASYFLVNGSNLFATFENQGIYVTQNLGTSWTKISTGLPQSFFYSLAADNTDLFAGTEGNSVWRRPLTQVTDVNEASEIVPAEFSLSQNYPNPFNPSTTINWQSPISSHQTLKVYDVLGNEVTTLVDEFRPAGKFEASFEAKELASGIYFYKLQSANFYEVRKMILIR